MELELDLELDLAPGAQTREMSRITAWTPQNQTLGPKWAFGSVSVSRMASVAISGTTFQNRKMSCSLPATGYTITAPTRGLPSKVPFYKTLDP